MATETSPRAPLAERALSRTRPRRPAVGHPPVLRHRGDDGRRHQPRRRRARLRHAARRSSRRASRACARVGPTTRATTGRWSCAARWPSTSTRRYGVRYDPANEILITVGASEAVDLAMRATSTPATRSSSTSRRTSPTCRRSCSPAASSVTWRRASRTTSRSIRPRVEAAITPRTKALFLGYPCNPTGAVLPDEVQDALAEIAVRHDLLVVQRRDLRPPRLWRLPSRAISALPGMRERTILIGGFSKAYAMTGWRVGYVAAPGGHPRGHRQGPPVRDHVGTDDRPGRRARRDRRRASRTSSGCSPSTTGAAGCSSTG